MTQRQDNLPSKKRKLGEESTNSTAASPAKKPKLDKDQSKSSTAKTTSALTNAGWAIKSISVLDMTYRQVHDFLNNNKYLLAKNAHKSAKQRSLNRFLKSYLGERLKPSPGEKTHAYLKAFCALSVEEATKLLPGGIHFDDKVGNSHETYLTFTTMAECFIKSLTVIPLNLSALNREFSHCPGSSFTLTGGCLKEFFSRRGLSADTFMEHVSLFQKLQGLVTQKENQLLSNQVKDLIDQYTAQLADVPPKLNKTELSEWIATGANMQVITGTNEIASQVKALYIKEQQTEKDALLPRNKQLAVAKEKKEQARDELTEKLQQAQAEQQQPVKTAGFKRSSSRFSLGKQPTPFDISPAVKTATPGSSKGSSV